MTELVARGAPSTPTVTAPSTTDKVQIINGDNQPELVTIGDLHSMGRTGNVAVAADVLVIPVTARHVSKTTGADAEALTLANGVEGQRLTVTLTVDGGGNGTLTPTTKTGFATIVFADAGDTATLEYVDDTVGWILVGASGVAAPPAITV